AAIKYLFDNAFNQYPDLLVAFTNCSEIFDGPDGHDDTDYGYKCIRQFRRWIQHSGEYAPGGEYEGFGIEGGPHDLNWLNTNYLDPIGEHAVNWDAVWLGHPEDGMFYAVTQNYWQMGYLRPYVNLECKWIADYNNDGIIDVPVERVFTHQSANWVGDVSASMHSDVWTTVIKYGSAGFTCYGDLTKNHTYDKSSGYPDSYTFTETNLFEALRNHSNLLNGLSYKNWGNFEYNVKALTNGTPM
ncbi:unnamed protein product, partial [marine sediment metagenome]